MGSASAVDAGRSLGWRHLLGWVGSRGWGASGEHPGDDVPLLMYVGGVGLGENGADDRGHHLGRALSTDWTGTELG